MQFPARIFLTASVCFASVYAGEIDFEVHNFHKVNDTVFRGAQPSAAGFAMLKKMGIATVIDLRESSHADSEAALVKAQGMQYINIPMKGMEAPSNAQIAKVLALINDAKTGPVFIHCKRGADRTGTVLACYRITHDHWDNAAALAEAKQRGMSVFQVAMHRYVKAYSAPLEVAGQPAN